MYNCKFCGNTIKNLNMQGYCGKCYRYFVIEGKKIYNTSDKYAPNGDCICPECGKAFVKLGSHLVQAHGNLSKNFYKSYGWKGNPRASNVKYRKHMKDIQQEKCITENLIERGKATRFKKNND